MIKTQIQQDSTKYLKESNKVGLLTTRNLLSAIKNKEIELQKDLSDGDIFSIIRKNISQLNEGIVQFQKANREDLVIEYTDQLSFLTSYLPPQISDAELARRVSEIISQNEVLVSTKPQAIIGLANNTLKNDAESSKIIAETKKQLGL